MHIALPWVEHPRAPRPTQPRVWSPRLDQPIEVVVLAPYRTIYVHWYCGRHWLHFDGVCPTCRQVGEYTEHGYASALVRWCTDDSGASPWIHGVAQLTEQPLKTVVYRDNNPWVYTLRRTRASNGPVEVTQRPCPRDVWLIGRPFDPTPVLQRLYGSCFRDFIKTEGGKGCKSGY